MCHIIWFGVDRSLERGGEDGGWTKIICTLTSIIIVASALMGMVCAVDLRRTGVVR